MKDIIALNLTLSNPSLKLYFVVSHRNLTAKTETTKLSGAENLLKNYDNQNLSTAILITHCQSNQLALKSHLAFVK